MSLTRKTLGAAIGLAALAISAAPAFATPAYSAASLNVRSGPGTGYSVVDTLYEGELVDVRECNYGWCYVASNGPNGWVSGKYLVKAGGYHPPVYDPPVYDPPKPGFSFQFGFGKPWPHNPPSYNPPVTPFPTIPGPGFPSGGCQQLPDGALVCSD